MPIFAGRPPGEAGGIAESGLEVPEYIGVAPVGAIHDPEELWLDSDDDHERYDKWVRHTLDRTKPTPKRNSNPTSTPSRRPGRDEPVKSIDDMSDTDDDNAWECENDCQCRDCRTGRAGPLKWTSNGRGNGRRTYYSNIPGFSWGDKYVDAYINSRRCDSDGNTIDSDEDDYLDSEEERYENDEEYDDEYGDEYVEDDLDLRRRAAIAAGGSKKNPDHLTQSTMDKYAEPTESHLEWQPAVQSLLLTSKQVREEALDILYGENVFRFVYAAEGDDFEEVPFPKKKLFRMKHVMLVFGAEELSDAVFDEDLDPEVGRLGYGYGKETWAKLLRGLKTLRLVADMPDDGAEHRMFANPDEHCKRFMRGKHEEWSEELSELLKYVGETVSPGAAILADVDEMKVTSKLLDSLLQRSWKHVRTTTGDELHMRVSLGDLSPTKIRGAKQREWMDQTFEDAPAQCKCHGDPADSGRPYGLPTWGR
ncbi:hypothetical protein GE09DRAFT_520384 [Coniochaeta sp. 2T2.1]|nr:hypothetical protein GE09DRAFT_520384 [Coniochaeta sp. 2T2.1]